MSFALKYLLLVYVALLGSQSLLVASASASNSNPRSVRDLSQAIRHDYTYTPGIGAHKVHIGQATWNIARRLCYQEGGHLAIINSAAEADVIVRLLNESNSQSGFIGVHNLYDVGEFVTIHGEPLADKGFQIWREGKPQNAGSPGNCLELCLDGKLNDILCDHRSRFICELPNVQSCTPQNSRNLEVTPAPEHVTKDIFFEDEFQEMKRQSTKGNIGEINVV